MAPNILHFVTLYIFRSPLRVASNVKSRSLAFTIWPVRERKIDPTLRLALSSVGFLRLPPRVSKASAKRLIRFDAVASLPIPLGPCRALKTSSTPNHCQSEVISERIEDRGHALRLRVFADDWPPSFAQNRDALRRSPRRTPTRLDAQRRTTTPEIARRASSPGRRSDARRAGCEYPLQFLYGSIASSPEYRDAERTVFGIDPVASMRTIRGAACLLSSRYR